MSIYDKYYQTENLFGEPYNELIAFFKEYPTRGTVLDLGCGQGRDAIALAKLGYSVTGVDSSIVGINQMKRIAMTESVKINCIVDDLYEIQNLDEYDIKLLDSMLHFGKKEFEKEHSLLNNLANQTKNNGVICFCVKKSAYRERVLKKCFEKHCHVWETLNDSYLEYIYKEGSHSSKTVYNMFIVKRIG